MRRWKLVRVQRIQREDGRTVYRSQIRSPDGSGKRLDVRGDTEEEVIARVLSLRSLRRDVKLGIETAAHRAHLRTLAEGALTIRQVWDRYQAAQKDREQKKQRSFWGKWFEPVFGNSRRAATCDGDAMREWERYAAGIGASRSHIKHLSNLLRAAFYASVRAGRLASVPWIGDWRQNLGLGRVTANDRHRRAFIELEDMRAVVAAAHRHDEEQARRGIVSDLAARAVCLFLIGLRQGELGGLGWDDFTEEGGGRMRVQVRHQVRAGWRREHPEWDRPRDPPKGVSRRRDQKLDPALEVSEAARRVLVAQRERLQRLGWYRPDGPVFPATSGPWAGTWRNDECAIKPERWRELGRAAGVQVDLALFVPHSARHSFNTHEARNAKDIGAWLARGRVTSLKVAQIYFHAVGRQLPRASFDLDLPDGVGAAALPEVAPVVGAAEAIQWENALLEAGAELAVEHEAEAQGRDPSGVVADLRRAWAEWVEAGRPTKVPKLVNELAQGNYARAYMRAIRQSGGDEEAARSAGRRSRHAFLGKWSQVAHACEREAGAEAAGPGLRKAASS